MNSRLSESENDMGLMEVTNKSTGTRKHIQIAQMTSK